MYVRRVMSPTLINSRCEAEGMRGDWVSADFLPWRAALPDRSPARAMDNRFFGSGKVEEKTAHRTGIGMARRVDMDETAEMYVTTMELVAMGSAMLWVMRR